MKILYISNSKIPSQTANSLHVMKMCQAFADNGCDVTLLAPNIKNINKITNVFEYYNVRHNFKIIKLWYPNFKGKTLIYCCSIILYLIKNKKFHLIYGRFLFGCFFAALLRNKVIFEAHDPIFKRRYLEFFFFNKFIESKYFLKLIVISDELKKIFLKKYFFLKNKIIVAHDGGDTISNLDHKTNLLGKKKNLKVGYVGSLNKGKGIEVIQSIYNKVKKNVEFHIVGGNKKEIDFWKNQIHGKNVFFYGFKKQAELTSYLNSFDICLLPNQLNVVILGVGNISSYTSPLKLFEYMSHKKAIISSDIKVIREVLNKKNSILVKYNDEVGWINAIEKLKSPSLRNKINRQAFIDFKMFSWFNRAKYILKIF